MYGNEFVFDLQRFDGTYVLENGITFAAEGFTNEGFTSNAAGNDLVGITTTQDEGGSVIVENDYNFTVDGHEVKIRNVASGKVRFTYGEDGIELDLSDLIAESGETIYVVSAADSVKLTPPTASESIRIGSYTYNYALGSGSDAYFKLNGKGTVTAFVEDVAGDAITINKNQAVAVYDTDDTANAVVNIASGTNYTVTRNKNNYTITVHESAAFTIGNDEFNVEVSEANKAAFAENPMIITFENDGTIVSIINPLDIVGTTGNDDLSNNLEDATITALGGNDTISNSGANVIIDGGAGKDSIENSPGGSRVSINGGDGNDLIYNGGSYDDYWHNGGSQVSINGGNGNDSIYNGGSQVTIDGGAGKDTITNSGSNVSIAGGKDNDSISNSGANVLFKYANGDGNDLIREFKSTDTLQIGDGTGRYSSQKSGDDIIVTVGNGKITLQGAAGLSTVNIAGTTSSTMTITDSTPSPVKADSDIKAIDASTRTTAVKLTGNELDNTLSGGNGKDTLSGNAGNDRLYGGNGDDKLGGGSGNDYLDGGTGNDSLWGGAGSDLFVYAEGDDSDYIFGFDNNDTLRLDDLDFISSYKSNALTLTVNNGSVTLKDFTATTFHINSDTYKISGNKLVK